VGLLLAGFALRASSIIPATSLGGMVVLVDCFLRLWGFIEGDCLTARAGFFKATEDVFLRDFRTAAGLEVDGGAVKSRFMSIGEVVSEPRTAP